MTTTTTAPDPRTIPDLDHHIRFLLDQIEAKCHELTEAHRRRAFRQRADPGRIRAELTKLEEEYSQALIIRDERNM